MEDIRIGRDSGTNVSVVSVGTGDTPIVQYNRHRIALLIAETGGQTVFLTPGKQAVASTGVPIKDTANQLLIDVQHHGQMVCQEWHGIAGMATTVVVVESILTKD